MGLVLGYLLGDSEYLIKIYFNDQVHILRSYIMQDYMLELDTTEE